MLVVIREKGTIGTDEERPMFEIKMNDGTILRPCHIHGSGGAWWGEVSKLRRALDTILRIGTHTHLASSQHGIWVYNDLPQTKIKRQTIDLRKVDEIRHIKNPHRWNPWFLSYCKAHGKSVYEMLDHDREEYPGGKMTGYVVWNLERRSEFFRSFPEMGGEKRMNDETVEAYTRWLEQRVEDGKSKIKFRIDPKNVESFRGVCERLDVCANRAAMKLIGLVNKMNEEELERRRRLLKRCVWRFNWKGGFRER